MKRFIHLILLTFIFIGCENAFRDELQELHSEIDELRTMIAQTNSNIEALQTIVNALQDNDYVTSVMPVTDNGLTVGYTITFSKSGTITIYHGKDGYTPVIGIRKDADGVYCWTLDGEWMLDEEGKRIPTTGTDGEDGVIPIMKIEEDYWHVSYDNGATWTRLDKAVGEDGDSMFKEVLSDERQVTLVLSDGTEIIIPCKVSFELILDTAGEETGALPGRQIRIKYTIANAATPTTVTASSDGKYSVSVVQETETEGYILIDCPLSYKDGYVNIIACDQTGYTVLRVINFYEEKMEFNAGFEYHIPADRISEVTKLNLLILLLMPITLTVFSSAKLLMFPPAM